MVIQQVIVWVAGNGSHASIQVLPPGATRKDVEFALLIKGVKNGMHWDEIDRAVARVEATGIEQRNIIVAEKTYSGAVWQLCEKNLPGGESDFKKECEAFRHTARIIAQKDTETAERQGVFVESGVVFLKIEAACSIKNVFGQELPLEQPRLPKIDTATIRMRRRGNETNLVAHCSGYVLIDSEETLRLEKPIRVTEDNMTMHFIAMPVSTGEQKLIDHLFNNADASILESKKLPERHVIERSLKDRRISNYEIRRGMRPVPGRDGKLTLKTGTQSTALLERGDRIDYKERTPFVEVAKGAEIAELIPAQNGTPGRDVYGNEISVEPVEDIVFTAGDNIEIVSCDGRLLFTSGIDGIAVLSSSRVDVMPELIIKGNVGPETGNVKYHKCITIQGDVLGGYKVQCGGDLTIKGNIENGVRIECTGKLFIGNGVFGENTRIFARSDAEIGFVQDSNVRVDGNAVVKKYVYNSKLTCGGFLRLTGQGVTGDMRGAAIGGRVCSMKSIKMHSVGSPAVVTELACGVDLEARDALQTAREGEAVAARKIVALQNSLGFDPFNSATISRIKQLPQARREQLKMKILEMKEVVQHRQNFLQKIDYFKDRAFSPDIENAFIEIEHVLVPDVLVRIGVASEMIHDTLKKTCLRVMNARIVW